MGIPQDVYRVVYTRVGISQGVTGIYQGGYTSGCVTVCTRVGIPQGTQGGREAWWVVYLRVHREAGRLPGASQDIKDRRKRLPRAFRDIKDSP